MVGVSAIHQSSIFQGNFSDTDTGAIHWASIFRGNFSDGGRISEIFRYGRLPGMSERSKSPVIPRVWSDDVRRRAYAIYAGAGKQNQTLTARLLSDYLGETVSQSTVQGWVDRDKWRERYQLETVADTRESMDTYIHLLWVAVPAALSTITSVANGSLSVTDEPDRLRAAQFIIDKAQALLLKQADSNRRAGRPKQATSALPSDVGDLDSDGLEQLEQQIRKNSTATAD